MGISVSPTRLLRLVGNLLSRCRCSSQFAYDPDFVEENIQKDIWPKQQLHLPPSLPGTKLKILSFCRCPSQDAFQSFHSFVWVDCGCCTGFTWFHKKQISAGLLSLRGLLCSLCCLLCSNLCLHVWSHILRPETWRDTRRTAVPEAW